MVHLTRLELAHPKALPPQGSVYTNFTTGAYGYYNIFFRYGEKNLEIIPIARGAIFFGILFPIIGARFLEFFIQNRDLNTPYALWSTILKGLFNGPINNIVKAVFARY